MITSAQCKTSLAECEELGAAKDITIRRAAALMAVSDALNTLVWRLDRYERIVKEEGKLAIIQSHHQGYQGDEHQSPCRRRGHR
jgi:hypothetical protein